MVRRGRASASGPAGGPTTISEAALRHNVNVLEYSRTCQAAAAGGAAGIIGMYGGSGFVFYVLCLLFQAIIWYGKSGADWSSYFVDRWSVVTHSAAGGLFTYILFWVFFYGIVHVY